MAKCIPSFRYHPTEAPAGKLFQSHAELDALGPEWVETPADFPTVAAAPAPRYVPSWEEPEGAEDEEVHEPVDEPLKKRGRKPKDDAERI